MSKVKVITDSTAYIPEDLVSKYNIQVLPQILIWDDETYRDGIDILPDVFYERLSKSKTMPSTSQITPNRMKSEYDKYLEEGFDVLGLFVSSELSGTIQSGLQAKNLSKDKKDRIEIVDSKSCAMALGFQVIAAAKAAQSGASLVECKKIAEKAKDNTGVLFVVDTLEFLHRGGRIGGGAKFLGTALKFKPILELQEGRIESIEKVRTKRKAYNRMLEILFERVKGREKIRIATLQANAEEDANILLDRAAAELNPIETIHSSLSPVVGTHAGPGTVGLAYQIGMD